MPPIEDDQADHLNNSGSGTEPHTGMSHGRRRRAGPRWRWFALAVLLGVGGTTAVLAAARFEHEPGSSASTHVYRISEGYVGPVWFTLGTPPGATAHVTIEWGQWSNEFDVGPNDPRTYWMNKLEAGATGEQPPVRFTIVPGTTMRVGLDGIPAGSRLVPDPWHLTGS